MNVSSWLRNWLDARRAEQSDQALDHAARLSLRKLEDRQVLSVGGSVVTDVVTFTGDGANDSLVISVDGDGYLQHNLYTDGSNGYESSIDLDNSTVGVQSLLVADISQLNVDLGGGDDSVEFAGPTSFQFAGSVNIDASVESTTLNVDITSSSGQLEFEGAVTLSSTVMLSAVDTDVDGAGVEFGSTLDGATFDLSISGGVLFVGSATDLGSLSADRFENSALVSAVTVQVIDAARLGGDVTTTDGQFYVERCHAPVRRHTDLWHLRCSVRVHRRWKRREWRPGSARHRQRWCNDHRDGPRGWFEGHWRPRPAIDRSCRNHRD